MWRVSHFSEQAMHDGIHLKMLTVVSKLETVHIVESTALLASVCLTDAKFVEVTRRGSVVGLALARAHPAILSLPSSMRKQKMR